MNRTIKIAAGISMMMAVVACTLASRTAQAAEGEAVTGSSEMKMPVDSSRMGKKLGFYLGVFNEPSPSLLSVNAAYNLRDFVRLTAGVGRLSGSGVSFDGSPAPEASATTVGAGAKFLVPGWSLTPTSGLHVARVIYSGTPEMISIGGLDYQSPSGFNIGVGINRSFKAEIGSSGYLNVGWFFDWLG